MNVKLYTINTEYPDCHSITPAAGRTDNSDTSFIKGKPSADYDRITIRGSQEQITETVPSERVMALRQQVMNGTYRTDSRQIAESLLAYGLMTH